jgi:hypothetical protein
METARSPKLFIAIITLVVLGTLGLGFYQTGGPGYQRNKRLDATRLNRLYSLQRAIHDFNQKNHQLPRDLEKQFPGLIQYGHELTEDTLRDPETEQPFTYRVVSPSRYTLCATFRLATLPDLEEENSPYYRYYDPVTTKTDQIPRSWGQHGEGPVCFTFRTDETYRLVHYQTKSPWE